MTDRELLELAAKAAGIELFWKWSDAERASVPFTRHPNWYPGGTRVDQPWNPLTDDGDALRLAVKLRMCMDTYMDPSSRFDTDERCTLVVLPFPSDYSAGEWHVDSDPYAATRRAIVRAAAEIGKAKP